jgi:hypothetical protein
MIRSFGRCNWGRRSIECRFHSDGLPMEIVLAWIIFAFVVAIAAGARGRSGAGWFLISILFSPLVGLILVLVLPNLREEEKQERLAKLQAHPALSGSGAGTQTDHSGPFEPDGVYSGVPYRVAQDGSIEAIMQGARVRFADMDRFTRALA